MVTGAQCLREKRFRRILSDHKSETLSLGLFLTALIWTGSGLCYGSTVSFLNLSHRSLYHPLPSSLSDLSPPFQTIDRSPLSLEWVFISRRFLQPFSSKQVCALYSILSSLFARLLPSLYIRFLHQFFSVCLRSYFCLVPSSFWMLCFCFLLFFQKGTICLFLLNKISDILLSPHPSWKEDRVGRCHCKRMTVTTTRVNMFCLCKSLIIFPSFPPSKSFLFFCATTTENYFQVGKDFTHK